MHARNKLTIIISCCAIFAAPLDARAPKLRTKAYHGHFTKRAADCPLHRTVDGNLADCKGWRYRNTAVGWDNTCFRSLEYLPAMYACVQGGE
jgi:hypothetical protein